MNLREIGCHLHMASETLEALEQFSLPDYEWKSAYSAFLSNPKAFYHVALQQENPNLFALAAFIHWIPQLKEKYDMRNLPPHFLGDNLDDLRIWSDECLLRTGKPGLIEWDWIKKTFAMEVFRIGRLQYEPRTLKQSISLENGDICAGTKVLEIHIPKGESLQDESLRRSLSRALSFFSECFCDEYHILHCHSWLLARELQSMLGKDSGILQFQRLFTIYEEDYKYRQAEERVFGCIEDNPWMYPGHTSLQQTLKEWLCGGHQIGMGSGIIIL